jgi:hypothetical protein
MISTKHKEEITDQIKFLLKIVYYAKETIDQIYGKELAPTGGPFGVFYHVPCAKSPISICVGNKSELFSNREGAWRTCIYCKQNIIDKMEEHGSKLNWK